MEENNKPVLEQEKVVDKKERTDRPQRTFKKRFERPAKLYEEKIIETKFISKRTTGGRKRRVSSVAVVGDRKGTVGIGTGKAIETPDAIKKAIQSATKNVVKIPLVDERTIPHEVVGKNGAARVILKPAYEGTGIKAGSSVRAILELAGVRDILSKSLGSRNKLNMALATLDGLMQLRSVEKVAKLRGKTKEEIL